MPSQVARFCLQGGPRDDEAETGVMRPQVQGCQSTPEAGRGRKAPPLEPSGELTNLQPCCLGTGTAPLERHPQNPPSRPSGERRRVRATVPAAALPARRAPADTILGFSGEGWTHQGQRTAGCGLGSPPPAHAGKPPPNLCRLPPSTPRTNSPGKPGRRPATAPGQEPKGWTAGGQWAEGTEGSYGCR